MSIETIVTTHHTLNGLSHPTINQQYSFIGGGIPYYINAPTPVVSTEVSGDMSVNGDIKIKVKSVMEMIQTINDRLFILNPDPKKLEKYEALKKAYDHYKLMEKIAFSDDLTENKK